jgi:proteasome assembly chaperone (PAC2) family protein
LAPQMDRILIKRFARPPGPVRALAVGFPGLGLVGATAAKMLLYGESGQSAKPVMSFYPYALSGIRSLRSGMTGVHAVRLRHMPLTEPEEGILILTAASQPPLDLQYELAFTVMGEAKQLGCHTIVTLGGYQTPSVSSARRVYFSANDLCSYRISIKLGLESFEGPITGAAGVFAGVGKLLGLSGGCMLGETTGEMTPDPVAASAVVSALMGFIRPNGSTTERLGKGRDAHRGSFLDSLS